MSVTLSARTSEVVTTSYIIPVFAKANGFPFDIELFTKELNRKHDENGKVINYSVRDRFVLASLDDDHYPEVGPLASLFKAAMLSYEENMKKCGK